MATIKDVARLANVDISTVSRVLNEKANVHPDTRMRVKWAAKELSYHSNLLARSLKEKRTYTIAIFVPTIRTHLFSDILKGAEYVARNHGYMIIVCNTENCTELEDDYINRLKSRHVDGIVSATFTDHSIGIRRKGIPWYLLFATVTIALMPWSRTIIQRPMTL